MIETELPRTAEAKEKAAQDAVKEVIKAYGEGSILRLGDKVGSKWPHIPTGIPAVDNHVCGIGGIPRSRITEIFGPEGGGKTTISLRAIATEQESGGQAAFIDAEHAFDPNWSTLNGVDCDKLFVSQPDCGEEALDIAERLIRSGGFGIVVVDSVAALVPRAELDGEMGDSNVGLQARLMSQAMRKLTGITHKSGTALVFINQIREKIGVMYGSPETTTGGRALKFYSSLRLDVRRIAAIKEGDAVVGNKVRVKGAKNKVAAPFKEAEVDLRFDCGFDILGGLIDEAVKQGVIDKSGAWFSYKGTRLGQGKNNSRLLLQDNSELVDAITKDLQGK